MPTEFPSFATYVGDMTSASNFLTGQPIIAYAIGLVVFVAVIGAVVGVIQSFVK
ncbi:hypothetical protein SAMN05661086_02972 [Anaeromicropila populeti]|uniref:Uncharacterized protein n=2 Tax=Anaeromicropila populeti TaxID=37658 RepID=A0A1I6L0W5_9FIRM|nr:hypothetical protein SAMN05661086_02972 [Anaeromicropila populeti]